MKKMPLSFFVGFAALVGGAAYGQTVTPDISITNTITAAIVSGSAKVVPLAVTWLGSFMALQFVLTNFALLKSGAEIEAVFGKLIGSLAWFGFCIYLLNEGPGFIQAVAGGILNQFAANIPTPGSIIGATLGLSSLLVIAIAIVGTSIVGIGNSSLAMLLVFLLLAILAIGLYLAIKIIMLYIELALIVALAPLSFSFLGLNALKDQGIAPLKSLIALVYRIVLLGLVYTAFTNIYPLTYDTINNLHWMPGSFGKGLEAVVAALCAYPIIAFLVFKSDAIASNLAGGGSSLGAADVASAAAAGAATGAAIGAASGGAVGLAGKAPEAMSNVLQNMMGGGGSSISNASSSGAGATSAARPPEAAASLGGQGGGSSAPEFPTNSAGAPQPPETDFGTGSQPAQAAADASDADSFEKQTASEQASGSGMGAEIGGNAGLDKAINALTAQLGQQNRKPTLGEHLKSTGQHIAQEKAATHISINTHHHD